MESCDLPWEFHKVYPSIDVQNIPGYPNHFSTKWRESFPKFDGHPALVITHVMNYMKCSSSLNVLHEYLIMKIFVSSLESSPRTWLAHSCDLKSIPSSTKLMEEFLRHSQPATQNLQYTFQDLKEDICREGFLMDDETIVEEWKTKEEYHPPTVEE
jgi:hypothetical protein